MLILLELSAGSVPQALNFQCLVFLEPALVIPRVVTIVVKLALVHKLKIARLVIVHILLHFNLDQENVF